MSGDAWTNSDVESLIDAYVKRIPGTTAKEFSNYYSKRIKKRTANGVRFKLRDMGYLVDEVVKESPYPKYDAPLVMEGDALVMSDIEFPFHHADFVNQCLDLAKVWGIRQAILAGDVLHFDSLSGWEANWTDDELGGIVIEAIEKLQDVAEGFRMKEKVKLLEAISEIGEKPEGDGVSTELRVARKSLLNLQKQFERIDFVIGNHEGRLLRALDCALSTKELLRLLDLKDDKVWRIAPYYFSILVSGGEKYIIEHPKNSSKFSAHKLASKYSAHVLMGHNHQYVDTIDVSGKYRAIEIGHCVDETRLPYAAQRHNASPTHALGACIVRDGYAWPLNQFSDWKRLRKL